MLRSSSPLGSNKLNAHAKDFLLDGEKVIMEQDTNH